MHGTDRGPQVSTRCLELACLPFPLRALPPLQNRVFVPVLITVLLFSVGE